MAGKPFKGMACPFCGRAAEKIVSTHWFTSGIKYEIGCVNDQCGIQPSTGKWVSEALCEDAWNVRTEEL